jgi:hypothetical protein
MPFTVLQDGCHAQMQIAYVLRTAEDQFNANLVTRILTTTPGNGCAAGGGLPSSCKYLDARKRTFAYTGVVLVGVAHHGVWFCTTMNLWLDMQWMFQCAHKLAATALDYAKHLVLQPQQCSHGNR